jgi:hypothetical protein
VVPPVTCDFVPPNAAFVAKRSVATKERKTKIIKLIVGLLYNGNYREGRITTTG